ncbi:MAG: hypothetical protein KF878_08725 [Planctomycetes bacterium]|nr:hypothetical protein [Planctomycetota bacterium]
MADDWKVTKALDKAGRGRAIIVAVKALGGAPVSLEQLGERFGLQPDRLLSALLFDERNRLAGANLQMLGEVDPLPPWNPGLTDAQIEAALADRRRRAVRVEKDAWKYRQLAAPKFVRWTVPAEATIYVPLHERIAPLVRADGQVSLARRVKPIDAAERQLDEMLAELKRLTDHAATVAEREVKYLLRVKSEQAILTWMDWVAYEMLRRLGNDPFLKPDAGELEKTREARKLLRSYRVELEEHLIARPHRVLKGEFPQGEGKLGGAAERLLKWLVAAPTADLVGEVARNPEQVSFDRWWALQSALLRAAGVLADARGDVRREVYARLVAPALGVLARSWREDPAELAPLKSRPGLEAAVKAPWDAAKLGGGEPTGAFARALEGVSSWTGVATQVGGLGCTSVELAERWAELVIERMAADPGDREAVAGVLFKLAVSAADGPSSWRRELAEALTVTDDRKRMERVLQAGDRAGLGLRAATSLMATASLVLSLRADPEVSLNSVASGLSALAGTGEVVEDYIALLRRVDDVDLLGFATLARFASAVGVISGAVSAQGVYKSGDQLGGHLALAKTALAALGLLVSGPLGAVLVAGDLAISYIEWNRDIGRGGGGRAFLALLDRLEERDGPGATLAGRLLEVPKLLDDHPRLLVDVARDLRKLYFQAAWWDVTWNASQEAGNNLLQARVPGWAVRLAVGTGPWPAGEPRFRGGETVLVQEAAGADWKTTTVVRAVASGAAWRYALKQGKSPLGEEKLAPHFAVGARVKVRVVLLPKDATVRKVDLKGGKYELELDPDKEKHEVPFPDVRSSMVSA